MDINEKNVRTNQCLKQTVQTQEEIQSFMSQGVPQYGPQSSYLVPQMSPTRTESIKIPTIHDSQITSYLTTKTTLPNIAPQSTLTNAIEPTSDNQKSSLPYGKQGINLQEINPHAREDKQDKFQQLTGKNNYRFLNHLYTFSSL